MGFDSIIAAGISLILLIVVSYVLFSGFFASVDSMTAAMKDALSSKGDQIKTNISVDYDYVRTYGHNITLDMYNTGNTKIIELSGVDMIMTFSQTLNNSTETSYWIPYVEDINATGLGWTAEEITPDMINPGIWDPGEKIRCRVVLPDRPLTGTLGWLVTTAPNGASSSGYFHVIQEAPLA
jgi:flagellar protein FlaF